MFKVYWDNDCGYGVEEFGTEDEAKQFAKDCENKSTNAAVVDLDKEHEQEQ